MNKHKEKQDFKEKLEKELGKNNNVNYSLYDDTSKFNVENSVVKNIKGLNERK